MQLCDHANVAECKVYINGGVWNLTRSSPTLMGIAFFIRVPWSSAGSDVQVRFQIVLTDGQRVQTGAAIGVGPIAIEQNVRVDSHVGMSPEVHLGIPLPINFPVPKLPDGERLIWKLEHNSQRDSGWRPPFNTVQRTEMCSEICTITDTQSV